MFHSMLFRVLFVFAVLMVVTLIFQEAALLHNGGAELYPQ